MSKRTAELIILLTVLFATVGVLIMIFVHIWTFSQNGISKNPEHWAHFGSYYGLVVSIVNTVAVIILSILVYRAQKRRDIADEKGDQDRLKAQIERDTWEKRYLSLQEKPELIFVSNEGREYHLYNMGKGTAHKIIIGKIPFDSNEIEKPAYKAYSIPPLARIIVNWSNNAGTLYAYYENSSREPHLVKCKGDVNDEIERDTTEWRDVVLILKENAERKNNIVLVVR